MSNYLAATAFAQTQPCLLQPHPRQLPHCCKPELGRTRHFCSTGKY